MSNFLSHHKLQTLSSFATIIASVFVFISYYYGDLDQKDSPTYEQQLDSLNKIENSITTLKEFVKIQKDELKISHTAIKQLKDEQQILQPLVEADKKVIEAMFKMQAKQYQQGIWIDRILGFLIGIASSLVASLLWAYIKRNKV